MAMAMDREETIMAMATDREEASQKKQAAAEAFLSNMASDEALPPPPRVSSSKRDRRDRDKDDGPTGDISREAWDRERERRKEEEKEREEEEKLRRMNDRLYDSKARDSRVKERERERERQRDLENERRRQCRADLEQVDSDDGLEPWHRRPIRSSRRAAERRKRRVLEEDEDAVDRKRHAEEIKAERGQRSPSPSVEEEDEEEEENGEAQAQPQAPEHSTTHAQPQAPEPDVDLNDPIYRAMMEAAKAPPKREAQPKSRAPPPVQPLQPEQHAGYGGFQPVSEQDRPDVTGSIRAEHRRELLSQSPPHASSQQAQPQAAGPPPTSYASLRPSSRKAGALAALFGDEDDDTKKRTLKPINYTQEELMAVQTTPEPASEPAATAAPPAASTDPKVQLRRLMDSIPTTKEGVWSYSIRWDAYNQATMSEKFSQSGDIKECIAAPEVS
eukprot:gene24965-10623_t